MHSVVVVLFFLYSALIFSLFSSFPITYLLQKAGRTQSGAGRNRTDTGHDSNAGRDKGAAEWEEEVEGQTGGVRRRVGGGRGKQWRAWDRIHVTAA